MESRVGTRDGAMLLFILEGVRVFIYWCRDGGGVVNVVGGGWVIGWLCGCVVGVVTELILYNRLHIPLMTLNSDRCALRVFGYIGQGSSKKVHSS